MAEFVINVELEAETAGELFYGGELVYYETDGKWWKTNASDPTKCKTELAIVLNPAIPDGTVKLLTFGTSTTLNYPLVQGGKYYVSLISGEITNVKPVGADDIVRYVGTALNASLLFFNPDQTYIKGNGTEINDVVVGVIIEKTSELINDGNGDVDLFGDPIPFITSEDIIPPVSEQIDVSATYVSALTFSVIANRFPVENSWYTSTAANVTLDAADAVFNRFDLLVGNTNGTVGKVTGTASATPSEPNWDSTTQYPIRFILVPANASDLVSYTDLDIFDEGLNEPAEWTYTFLNPGSVLSTNDFFSGAKSIEHIPVADSYGYISLTHSATTVVASEINTLTFAIKLKGAYNSNINLQLKSNGNLIKGYSISHGQYGFDGSDLAWQLITVPVASANLTSVDIDEIIFYIGLTGFAGFFLDLVIVQVSTDNIGQPPIIDHPQYTSAFENDGNDNTSTYVEHDEIGAVATSNSYDDLDDKPTITDDQDASEVSTDTTNFDGHLSVADDTVQKALETLDGLVAGNTSPLTTKGDIFAYDTDNNRLPVGSDDEVLIADSTVPLGLKWGTPSASGETKLHTEAVAVTTWTFNHNLNNLRPIVQVIGSDNKVVIPQDIEFVSLSQCVITFPIAVSGFATATVGGTSTIQPNTIGLGELTDQYKKVLTNVAVGTSQALDWDAYSGFVFTMTGETTFSDIDLPASPNETQISILMTGDFPANFPAYYKFGGDTYDGTVWNYLAIECKDNTGSSEQVVCLITNLT